MSRRRRWILALAACLCASCAGPASEVDARIVVEAVAPGGDAALEPALLARARASDGIDAASIERAAEGRFELALRAADPGAVERLAAGLAHRADLAISAVAAPEDGVDLDEEQRRLDAWLAAHPDAPLAAFARLARADGGPDPRVRWAEHDAAVGARRRLPLLVQPDAAWRFDQADLAEAYPSRDARGYPAIGFELRPERKDAFGDFTEAFVDRELAIEIGGRVRSLAEIHERLPGQGIVQGSFDPALVEAVAAALDTAVALPADVRVVDVRR